MDNEIESLWLSLGIKPDDPSASDAVDKIIKTVQSKLKSSIYGGKDGVITLPATIEGKFKNGREIDKSITDAYAAIYKKAKQMADESVSLTLEDIEDFKAQIDKFGKKTSKYKSSDIISNANNNLRQMLSTYQDYVNELRIEVSKIQKVQIKQTQKAKAQQKAKTKRPYHGITDEEIESNIQSEQKRRLSGIKQAEPRGYKRYVGFEGGVATDKTLKASDRGGPYPSNYARQMKLSELAAVKWMKKSLKTYQSENIADDYANALQNGKNKNNISDKQKADETANLISNELAKILGGLEANRPDTSIDQFNKYLEATLQSGKNGKGGYDAILLALNKTFHRYFNTDGTIGITDGGKTGVGEGHRQAQRAITRMIKAFKEKLETGFADKVVKVGEQLVNVSAEELRQLRVLARIDPRAASKEVDRILNGTNVSSTKQGSGSKLDQEVNRLVQESKNTTNAVKAGTKATETQTVYDKNANVKSDTDMAKEINVEEVNRDVNRDVARAVKIDETTGFNTDTTANELISVVRDISGKMNTVSQAVKNATSQIHLPSSAKDLYKALPDPNRLLGLPKPDGRRKKISDGMKDENPPLSLIPVQDALKKSLAVIPNEFAKTLKESIHPSVKDIQHKIDRPEGTNEFKYDEDMLRRLANASNARKEMRRRQDMNYTSPPRTIVPDYQPQVKHSDIYASPIKTTLRDVFENFLNDLTGASAEYKKIVNASTEQQDKMAAERVRIWGMNNGRNPNDTGDIAAMRRILELYRNNKASIEQNPELMQKIKLTDPIEIDTTEVTKAFNKALSGRNMQNAQMGGSVGKQILGAMRGFTFMPSIEKSRAQADGLNQILGIINKSLNSLLSNIQMHETTLAGMEESGQARFNADGTLTEDSTSAAKKTLADLEESKYVLEMLQADLLANEAIVKRTGGNYGQMIKQLSFASPILRDCNGILRNMNAGLDKNGKALKFQTRMAEILNYTFQLISRSIGQWFKKIITMLNPLNIIKNTFKTITGWIKSAFQDFGSYDTKWQRTMNVIKINFQRAIKPAMEWIAQKLVNIIGFFNIISMKVQEAFGQVPVDLFDQAGANAEKMRRELEKAANVTAGFDELHDIGSDNSGENDLLGDIYKPQLSQEWIDMANEIGDLLAGLIKGEKTVGEVFGRIFEMLLDLLGKIAKAIWDWFKTTSVGKYLIDNWKKILATILAVFIGWQLLKIAGPMLLKAIFGKLMEHGVISGIFSKIGGWISSGLSSLASKGGVLGFVGSFGQGIIMAFQTLFTGGKYSLLGTLKEMFTSSAAITEAGSWGSMIGFAITKALGAALAGAVVAKGFDMVADDASYNIGLKENGGKDKDQKSGLGGKLLGAAGGAALAGLVVGGPIAMGVGAIVGLLVTSLAPAIEEITTKSKDMNNELQKIEYYEGAVKGAESVVDDFTEKLNLSNDTVDAQKDKVYKLGEKYDVSKTELDKLVKSIEDGNYQTEMSAGYNDELSTALDQLDWHYKNNKDLSDKLTEAKKKLAKAELDLSIASDIEAGNFELAAARIEYAMASDLYTTDEAAAKMAQIMKETSFTEATELLNNCSPELQKKWNEYTSDIEQGKKDITDIFSKMSESERDNLLKSNNNDLKQKWFTYATTTREGKKELAKMYSEMNDEERRAFEKDYSAEAGGAMSKAIQAMQREINSASWDWSHPFKSLMSTFSGDWSWKAKYASFDVGTNYVPNDGFAYIHKGEAIIPADQNVFADQGKAFSTQSMTNEELVQAIRELKVQMQQGVNVKGQFVQRGSDLVATVEKANNRMKNNVLNNKVYAR